MPIKSLAKQEVRFGAGLPRLAKLKKGAPKTESGFGADLDHFRIAFEAPYNQDPTNLSVWAQLYGEKPTVFNNVFLLGQTTDEVFSAWYENYGAGAVLKTRCDGETKARSYNEQTARWTDTPSPCTCDPENRTCKQVGRLNFIPYDFVRATGHLGYITLETHSLYDIIALTNHVTDIFRLFGTVTGVPFVLGRADRLVSTRYGNKRRQATKSLVYLHPARQFAAEQLAGVITQAPQLGGQQAALPASTTPAPTTTTPEPRWTPERIAKLDAWARQGLGVDANELLQHLEAQSWEQFADGEAVVAACRAKGWPVIVRSIRYTTAKDIDLLTVFGAVNLPYSMEQLLSLLKGYGDRFKAVHKPDTWKAGKEYPIEPHRLHWIDKAGLIEPKKLEPLDAEPAEYEEVDDDE